VTRVAVLGGGGTEAVHRARAVGAELICLPQLSFLPYLPGVLDRAGLGGFDAPIDDIYVPADARPPADWPERLRAMLEVQREHHPVLR
jgi:hypothetical protein